MRLFGSVAVDRFTRLTYVTRRAPLFGLFGAALVVGACSGEPPVTAPADEDVGQTSDAIINGTVDTTHQAVVMIYSQQGQEAGLCSGTIVKVDPDTKIGWVLTAAHCVAVPPMLVIQGDDFNTTNALQYGVIDYKADPRYRQSGDPAQDYDVAVIRIAGVDAKTPTLPIATASDGVKSGTAVTAIGYGRTTLISAGNNDTNTKRRKVSLTVNSVKTASIGYDMSQRGICQGDSGGPDLVTVGGQETVVAVHSYVSGDCNGQGTSGRVSGNLTFINQQLAAAAPKETCDLCTTREVSGEQECAKLNRACLEDRSCAALYDCLTKASSASAQRTCFSKYPESVGPFTAAATCQCNRECKSICGGTSDCSGVPKCGASLPAGKCTTCTEGSCCQETLDCTADGTCYQCLQDPSDPACAKNAARKKLADCVVTSCKSECSDSDLGEGGKDTGGDSGNGDDDDGDTVTTTTTTTGCSTGAAGGGTSAVGVAGMALALGLLVQRRRRS